MAGSGRLGPGEDGPRPVLQPWAAHYFDGRTAARRRATVRPLPEGLETSVEEGPELWWPRCEVLVRSLPPDDRLRLERGDELPEILVVDGAGFLAALYAAGWAPAGARSRPGRGGRAMRLGGAALAALAVGTAAYLWLVPLLAAGAVALLPAAWEERLGEAAFARLVRDGATCADPARLAAIEQIAAALAAPVHPQPYTFRVLVVDDDALNALALPGGHIVLTRGLLAATDTPEEVAAVLAHEMQHILRRHAAQGLLQELSTGALLGAVAGGDEGAARGLGLARHLGLLSYSRTAEEAADLGAVEMLRAAGIDAGGMAAFLETLRRHEGDLPHPLAYLSTHPRTEDRIAKLLALAGEPQPDARPLLPGHDWRHLRLVCSAGSIMGPTPSGAGGR